jgi:hypothetical protein
MCERRLPRSSTRSEAAAAYSSRHTLEAINPLESEVNKSAPSSCRRSPPRSRVCGTAPWTSLQCSLPYRLAHVMPGRMEREPVKPTSFLFLCHGEVSARRCHCRGVDLPERVRVEWLLSDERRLVYAAPGSEFGTLSSQPGRCRTSRPKRRQRKS